jgi:hypothetical protein
MHVHVICRDTGHVIPRLAKSLIASSAGRWTIGETPNPTAHINYFFPYLELERFPDFDETPTAAYFSHYEKDNDHKTRVWNQFKDRVDIPIVTAQLYAKHFTNATLARPAIDPQFVPARKRPATRSVGVSGVIAKSSKRKGEHLVYRAAKDADLSISLRASGKGWREIPQQFYAWQHMSSFFQSLDVFLCTSSIEGVPMTTLEAMACGVPCVVPAGVGLHDELGDIAGLYRYRAGDYDDMKRVLLKALEFDGSNESLVEKAREYSAHNWFMDHQRAFEQYLYNVPQPALHAPWNENNAGLYVVAFGENARNCARLCIQSFKKHMSLPAALVSDSPLGCEDIFIERDDTDIGARGAKLSVETLAPAEWDYVLYLDADTEVTAPIGFLFDALADGWEFVICKNPVRYHVAFNMVRPDYIEECEETFKFIGTDEAIQLNGGVWAYRRTEQARKLMLDWYNEWNRYGARDQAALLRAHKKYPVRTYVLGNEWNTVDRYQKWYAHETAGIMHYPMTARRWEGRIDGRLDSRQAWSKVKR